MRSLTLVSKNVSRSPKVKNDASRSKKVKFLSLKNQVTSQNKTVDKSFWKNYFQGHLRSKISEKSQIFIFNKTCRTLINKYPYK